MGISFLPHSWAILAAKNSASKIMSSPLSLKGGRKRTSKERRSKRSLLNFPSSTKVRRLVLVAPTIRTSTSWVLEEPTRSKVPYSTTLKIFSCTSRGMRPISSRKRVPPSASSKRPFRAFVAPVKAPSSYPKSSLSISEGGRAAQLTVTNCFCHLGLR